MAERLTNDIQADATVLRLAGLQLVLFSITSGRSYLYYYQEVIKFPMKETAELCGVTYQEYIL